jgi:hypothetical protein
MAPYTRGPRRCAAVALCHSYATPDGGPTREHPNRSERFRVDCVERDVYIAKVQTDFPPESYVYRLMIQAPHEGTWPVLSILHGLAEARIDVTVLKTAPAVSAT